MPLEERARMVIQTCESLENGLEMRRECLRKGCPNKNVGKSRLRKKRPEQRGGKGTELTAKRTHQQQPQRGGSWLSYKITGKL